MEKMLINATQGEEVRVALIKDNYLLDLDIESVREIKKKGSIYAATIMRIEASLDAVFVNYGSKRQGFLPIKEIAPEYFSKKPSKSDEKQSVTSLLREGQKLLVQVEKEERGNKGAALTTFITLAGCYLVLMPNSPRSGGISRRIEGEDRDELKEALNSLSVPDDMGIIIRTAGVGKAQEELQSDLDMLCNQWQAIKNAYHSQLAPCLIHQESDVIIRAIRDNLRKSIEEIVIDDQEAYVRARKFIGEIQPNLLPNLKLYKNTIPLFNFYQIESQIEMAYKREVPLPSGGALVIDRTEALVSIDINSAKATSGIDIEATALNTNMEAADEIARQLRLRDLGGLVVIDFIDMNSNKNQREVENRLKEALKADRARIQVGRISRFGLLEMSRQRLRLSLGESAQEICPRCDGRGTVRNIQSQGLSIIRLIEEEALKEKTSEIQVQLPSEMATYLMNEKRDFILNIEKRHSVHILIIANPYLHSPQYTITKIKEDNKTPSYLLAQQPEISVLRTEQIKKVEPVVKNQNNNKEESGQKESGFFLRLWNNLLSNAIKPEKTKAKTKEKEKEKEQKATETPPQKPKQSRPHHQQSGQKRPYHHNRSRQQSGNRRRSGGNQQSGNTRAANTHQDAQKKKKIET